MSNRVSKAKTLRLLSDRAKQFIVDPFACFTVSQWLTDHQTVIRTILEAGLGDVVIVRSSAVDEDVSPDLPPGEFRSQLDIPMTEEALSTAVDRVIASYGKRSSEESWAESDEVIVQRQVVSCSLSGILTSRDIASDAPYYTIEYDDQTGRTNTVTAGKAYKRVQVFRPISLAPSPWDVIIQAARAIEQILDNTDLVIEFAVDSEGQVHVFQARQDPVTPGDGGSLETPLLELIESARDYIRARPLSVWSDMTDWNPGEMLGDRPRPLDISLYEHLITNSTWAAARASLGYTDARPRRLMETIVCKPYIDVETAFLSLTPASLATKLKQRFVKDRLDFLRDHPELHDKVELDVIFTCSDILVPSRTQVLRERGFSQTEASQVETTLHSLTAALFQNAGRLFEEDANRRAALMNWRQQHPLSIVSSGDSRVLAEYISEALLQCRRLGVFSFARLARLAFIGRDLLARLVVAKACSPEWLELYWRSFNTVPVSLALAMGRVARDQMRRQAFNEEFGHLRPRTYDITSTRYDQIDLLSIPFANGATMKPSQQSALQDFDTLARISAYFREANLPFDALQFLDFVGTAVRDRESCKFEFSAVLSDCLEAIAVLGTDLGFSRGDMAYLTIADILLARQVNLTRDELRSRWADLYSQRRARWQLAEHSRLPSVILKADDLVLVRHFTVRPNFITLGHVEGQVVVLTDPTPNRDLELHGKIVAVEAADPGFDWLFSSGIAGLVTRFGGAASHMAIRCARFGIPAVIGCGEETFRSVSNATRIRLDCLRKEILYLE